jgi:low affinity Fe/Cu permease
VKLLRRAAVAVGSLWALLGLGFLLGSGVIFGWTVSWWNWMNGILSVVAIVLAIVVQAAQNHDTQALQLKLDELIRVTAADNSLRGIERQ